MTDFLLLDGLSPDTKRHVLTVARRRRFKRQEVLFHEGDPGDTLHLVDKGHVALRIHTPLGDVATVRVVRAGDFIGELAVVMPGPRNATAVALDAVETLAISRDELDALRAEHPRVDALLINALTSEVRRLALQLVEVMYVPVEKRLWRRLTELSAMFGRDEPAREIPLTQDILAQLIGCTRPTANRILRAAEEDGVIRKHVSLVNPGAVGLPVSVFVSISLERQVEEALKRFERVILARPEVMECYLMTGDADYLLRVVCADLAAYERFVLDHLTKVPGVSSIRSSFALKQVKYSTALPLV